MKDDHIDIDRMVMESHYLDSLEREQEANIAMDNMITLEEHNKQMQELRDIIQNLNGIISTMRMTMDSLQASNDKNTEQMAKMQVLIESLTQELHKYQDRNNRHNKERYGSTSQKRRDEKCSKKSRQEESDDYDNSHSENDTNDSSTEDSTSSSDTIMNAEKMHSEHLSGIRGPRGNYNTMDAAVVETLETSLEHFPKDAKFRGYKTVDEYSKVSYIKCTRYIVAICEDKYGNRHDYYESKNAEDSRIPNRDVIPGTSFLPSLGADLVLDRYDVMIPNHREAKRMKVDRFSCCHNTRLNAMKAMAALLEPIYRKMKEKVLTKGSILNIDETWTKVRIKFKGDTTKLGSYFKKYIWAVINKSQKVAFFLYDNDENDSRGKRPIQDFLEGFEGAIQSDGYNVYKLLVEENEKLQHILCWAHVRAKFYYAEQISKQQEASQFLDDIGYLYTVETEILVSHLTPEQTKKRRKKSDVTETLMRLRKRARNMLADKHAHYSDLMIRALNYMLNGWDDLIRYREDGRYTIDNMEAERSIRPFVVSRKGSMFFSSEAGVKVAMIFHTIIETAKMWGQEVKGYLSYVMSKLIHNENDYEKLLPSEISL
jgi:transposase